MKRGFCSVLSGLSALLFLIASLSASSACIFWFYQPKVPKSLRKS
ncbi:MAG: cyclic lactone autoinducer peptide [Bacillota bacterium]|nr:cyclic lactone autoinducer peptide [Bacillota bacterium]